MKNLYRKYKISQLLDEPLSNDEKLIIGFISHKLKNLTLLIDDDGCYNYMNSKGEFIFKYNEEDDRLWVRYYGFWSVLIERFSLSEYDVRDIIKGMVETTYKIKVGRVLSSPLISNYVIESVYNKIC
jgi:hypothetical protein